MTVLVLIKQQANHVSAQSSDHFLQRPAALLCQQAKLTLDSITSLDRTT